MRRLRWRAAINIIRLVSQSLSLIVYLENDHANIGFTGPIYGKARIDVPNVTEPCT